MAAAVVVVVVGAEEREEKKVIRLSLYWSGEIVFQLPHIVKAHV